MIGHYLLTLTVEQEDRALTHSFGGSIAEPCLCMVVGHGPLGATSTEYFNRPEVPGMRYERLLMRFGAPRVNVAIRNRILSNRARRILGHSLVSAGAP